MSSFRLFALSVLLVLSSLAVSACGVNTVAPARSLADAVAGNAYDPAVAVEADSTKHFVWEDCNSSTCNLVYYRTKLGHDGIQVELPAQAGESYVRPDVAVDDSGTAWIVWSVRSGSSPDYTYRDYYTSIPANAAAGSHTQRIPLAQNQDWTTTGHPRVAARGAVVHAVYEVYRARTTDYENDTNLFYRQLADEAGSGGVYFYSFPGTINSDAALAVDVNGVLHVAWLHTDLSQDPASVDARYTNVGGGSGPSEVFRVSPVIDPSVSPPTLAVDSEISPTVYVAGSYTSGTADSDQVYVWSRDASDNRDMSKVDMSLGGSWNTVGKISLALVNKDPQLAFSAAHNGTDSWEIWYASAPDASPDRLTSDSVQDGAPLLVSVGRRADNGVLVQAPVITWRQYNLSASIVPRVCYGAAFAHFEGGTHLLAPDQGGCNSGLQDAAAAGDWAATIWLEQSADDSRQVPWIDFNAHLSRSPLVLR